MEIKCDCYSCWPRWCHSVSTAWFIIRKRMQFLLAHQLNQPDFVMTGVFLTRASHTCQCYQEKVSDVCIYPKLKKKKNQHWYWNIFSTWATNSSCYNQCQGEYVSTAYWKGLGRGFYLEHLNLDFPVPIQKLVWKPTSVIPELRKQRQIPRPPWMTRLTKSVSSGSARDPTSMAIS